MQLPITLVKLDICGMSSYEVLKLVAVTITRNVFTRMQRMPETDLDNADQRRLHHQHALSQYRDGMGQSRNLHHRKTTQMSQSTCHTTVRSLSYTLAADSDAIPSLCPQQIWLAGVDCNAVIG